MKINFGFKPIEERKIRNKRLKPGDKLEIKNLGTKTDKEFFTSKGYKIGDIVTFLCYSESYVTVQEMPGDGFLRTCFKLIE